MAIEARKSVWGKSWHWKPPFVPIAGDSSGRQCVEIEGGPGTSITLQPCHALAVLPDTRYVISGKLQTDGKAGLRLELNRPGLEKPLGAGPGPGWTRFQREFTTGPDQWWLGPVALRLEAGGTIRLDGLSLKEAGGAVELLWEADPNRPARGRYNPVDCFMLDQVVEAAEKNGIYLQLCLITRDLYMHSLTDPSSKQYDQAVADAKKLLRYAVARWGYSTHVAVWEYFNEMDPGLPTDRFYAELGEYLERIDVYGHLRTTSAWHPSPKDMRHPELDVAQLHFYLRPGDQKRLKDEVEAVADRTRLLREHAPRKPALIGEFGLANEKWQPRRPVDRDDQLADLHNSLWASALSGGSGTVLFWWWDKIEAQNGYHHYRPLAAFLDGLPVTTAGLQPATATVSAAEVRLVGLQAKDRAYLWLFNPQASWLHVAEKRATPSEVRAATLEIRGLAPGSYRAEWWDTYQGTVLKRQDVSPSPPALRLEVPAFSRDIACKICPRD